MKAYRKPKSENITAALKEYNRKKDERLKTPFLVPFSKKFTGEGILGS